jgi:L-ornithine Nalpha-acyltransferase
MRALTSRRDADVYDPICEHLLVVDHEAGPGAVVGTYRMLRQDVAEKHGGFYTQREYDIASLLQAKPSCKFLELGRSCVHPSYRGQRTVELLWHGLWTYIRENNIDVIIGCASFPGTDPRAHAKALGFLHHHALAPPAWRVRAHQRLFLAMDRVPLAQIETKAALKSMPPLIKGYLRLGAYFGDGAVIDHQFGTTDVLVILPVERIAPRYFSRFGAPNEQTSRIGPKARGLI